MDAVTLGVRHRATLIGGVAGDIEDAAEHAFTNRDRDLLAAGGHFQAALETFRGAHGDCANPLFAEVLLHFEHEAGGGSVDVEGDLECFVDLREQSGLGEIHVNDGTDDLDNRAGIGSGGSSGF